MSKVEGAMTIRISEHDKGLKEAEIMAYLVKNRPLAYLLGGMVQEAVTNDGDHLRRNAVECIRLAGALLALADLWASGKVEVVDNIDGDCDRAAARLRDKLFSTCGRAPDAEMALRDEEDGDE